MKIAFIITSSAVITGKKNGIRSQALTWKKGLEQLGHTVDLINNWGDYDWNDYQAIHIFGYGKSIDDFVSRISQLNGNVYLSPIIDSIESPFLYKLSTFLGLRKLRMYSLNYNLKRALGKTKGVFVRSDHELRYVHYSLGTPLDKIYKIPLSYGLPVPKEREELSINKEPFCFHVSSIYQPRKNVIRLIKAAVKYNFNLKLAGDIGTETEFEPIKREIGQNKNIEVLGYLSKEDLIDNYKRAKVFALPSVNEGVGIVGLDAAIYCCNIVITELGGPKEYYNEMAFSVNPFNVDDIGSAVVNALNDHTRQPKLSYHIGKELSLENTMRILDKVYRS